LKLKYLIFSQDFTGYDCQDREVKEDPRSPENFANSFEEQPISDLFNQIQSDPQHPPFNFVVPQTENFDESACSLAASQETEGSCLQQIYQTDQLTFLVTIPKQYTQVTKESANFQIKIEKKFPNKTANYQNPTKLLKSPDWVVSTRPYIRPFIIFVVKSFLTLRIF
jgi:CRISPR/Cas system CMR-associated protein Cmr1 (group 7 of RAMP superfamily)